MEVPKPKTIDQYISQFPIEVQSKLEQLRGILKKLVPNAAEKISYGIPTFALDKNLVHFAAFKNHIGFYALPTSNVKFQKELSKYKTGKGSIQFPLNEDLPIELIENLVKYRIMESQNHSDNR
jgi:uncharacterized protein YdhG (YjbR/CyaY superfamily)